MGAWGPGVFDDDLALDIRATFEDALSEGLSVEEATQQILAEHRDELEDPDEGPIVWLALAALQLERGMLQSTVRDSALGIIKSGQGLDLWEEQGADVAAERKRVLDELRARIMASEQEQKQRRLERPQRKRARVRVGDCFMIPLPDQRKAYGQYVCRHDWMGPLVQIFAPATDEEVPLELLEGAKPLFPSVFVSVDGAVADDRWYVFGRLPIEDFVFPKFRYLRRLETPPGIYHDWWIWDGENDVFVGDLPPEYRSLELREILTIPSLEERIVTGKSMKDLLS